jgi:hypothetical protein
LLATFQGTEEEDSVATEPDWNSDDEEEDSESPNLEAMIERTMIDTIDLTDGGQTDSSFA